jgi:hypothetical protein
MQGEQPAIHIGRAEVMFELLVKHRAIGKAGQHIVERKLGDPLLAFRDLPDHLVEACRKAGKLVGTAHAHLDVFARSQSPGSFVKPRERLSNPAGRAPRRKCDHNQPKQGHDGERELELAGVGERLGFRIGKQEDRPIAA